MHQARELVSQVAWRLRSQTGIGLEELKIGEGKFVVTSDGSKVRSMALFRVGVPDTSEDPRADYSAALKNTLQQQRMRGLFEGLRRAGVPFVYMMLMNQSEGHTDGELLEFDLVVGTWVDSKKKEDSAALLEQRASILSATLTVALPTATVVRLVRRDLADFMKSALLPGGRTLPQTGPASVAGALCSFDEMSPVAANLEKAPEFYIPNAAESGPDGILLGAVKSGGREYHDIRLQMDDLRRHVSVLGMTGSGKSTTAASIVRQVAEGGLPTMVLDWHNEYADAIAAVGGKVVTPGKDDFAVNPLEVGPGSDPAEHVAMVSDIFSPPCPRMSDNHADSDGRMAQDPGLQAQNSQGNGSSVPRRRGYIPKGEKIAPWWSLIVEESSEWKRFRAALPNPATRKAYTTSLGEFLQHSQVTNVGFAELAREDAEKAEGVVTDYIQHMKGRVERREVAPGAVRSRTMPVKFYCEVNRLRLEWGFLKRQIPKSRRYADDRAPTRDEIRRLLNLATLRMRVAIEMMASGGFRVGAWDYLSVKDVEAVMRGESLLAGKVTVYRGEPEQYVCFVTPEAYRLFAEYMGYRKVHGENLVPEAPAVRDEFAVSQGRKGKAAIVRRFPSSFIERELCRILTKSGLRDERKRRYDFKAAHGFRKFFKTQCFGPRTSVFTSEGVKQIRKVRAGDMVLTGSGHYRAVKRVFTRPYVGEKMRIDFGSSSSRGYAIHPTPEHPILTPLGYVEARYIKKGDLVGVLAKRCPECGKIMPFFRTFCSRTCATREMHRRFEVLAKFRFYGGKAAMAAGFSIEEKRIEYQRRYLARRGINANEYWLGLLLDRLAPGRFRYVGDGGVFVGKYCPDFVDEGHKTIIEVFGGWHKRAADGERRTAYFMERGYRTIIVWEEEMRRPIKLASRLSAELGRMIPPHNQADFVFTKVVWSAMKTTKRSLKVYNLEVDVDNSYLANGVVVHNCEQVMRPANVEVLMGHSMGVSDSYYRPTEKQLLEDYLKAVPLLSITEAMDVHEIEEKLRAEFEARLARLEGEMREYLRGQAASAWRQAHSPTPQAATSGQ